MSMGSKEHNLYTCGHICMVLPRRDAWSGSLRDTPFAKVI
jgi:hypothetical protein